MRMICGAVDATACLVLLWISCAMHLTEAYLTDGEEGEPEDYTVVTTIVEELNTTEGPSLSFMSTMEEKQLACLLDHFFLAKELEFQGAFCEPDFDNITCWPPTIAGQNTSAPCPIWLHPDIRAYRSCLPSGHWAPRTDYNECLKPPPIPTYPPPPALESALTYVYLVGCSLSLVLLTISLFIFCYFKSLQCTRIAIHKNLVVSFMLRYICMIVVLRTLTVAEFAVLDGGVNYQRPKDPLRNAPGFCRFILVLLEYCSMANIFWMFVEGMYLTSRISVAVFSRESNFKLYIFIGWVSPSYAVITWAVLMHYHGSELPCWADYLESPYIWIVRAPMIAAIFVNSVFLINIIRILVTKLQASNTVETAQMRKAVKAVAVLFPLLGLTNLVFLWAPNEQGVPENIYQVANAVLQSAQGIFVSVIYCFLNTEVRMAIHRRLSNNMDVYGNNTSRTRRHTTQTHTNGSCVIATSSEVAMAVTFQKKLHPPSPTEPVQCEMQEIKPLRGLLEDSQYDENEVEKQTRDKCQDNRENSDDANDENQEALMMIITPSV